MADDLRQNDMIDHWGGLRRRLADSPIGDAATSLRSLRFPDMRSKGKIEEDEANAAAAAGTATPAQSELVASNKRLLNSPAGDNPFDTPITPFVIGSVAQAAPSLVSRAGESLRSGISLAKDAVASLGTRAKDQVIEPAAAVATNVAASLRGALPGAAPKVAAPSIMNPNVGATGSREAQAFLASRQAPAAAAINTAAEPAAAQLASGGLRGFAAHPLAASTAGAVLANSGLAMASTPPGAAPLDPATGAPDNASVAVPSGFAGLRGGVTRNPMENGVINYDVANENVRQSLRGMQEGQAVNLGRYDGNADIMAQRGANGVEISGVGKGSSGYENSQQYKDGVARAAADKTKLAGIEDKKREQDLIDNLNHSTVGGLRGNSAALGNYYAGKRDDAKVNVEGAKSLRQQQTELLKFGIEQSNKARDFGQKQDEQDFNHAKEADSKLTERLGTMFRTTDENGKDIADTAKVADYKQSISAAIGQRIAALRAVPKDDPRYTQAQSEAEGLSRRGTAQLGDDALMKIVAQLGVRDRAAAGHSAWNPFAATLRDSANPDDYNVVGVKKGILQDQYVTKNGTQIPVNDLRYTEPANALAPDLRKVRTSRFDPAIEKGLRK